MNGRIFAGTASAALLVAISGAAIAAQAPVANRAPTTTYAAMSGPAQDGTPAWRILGSFPDPGGSTDVAPGGKVTVVPRPSAGPPASGFYAVPPCRNSPVCTNPIGPARGAMLRVTYDQTMGYTYAFPIDLPRGFGGTPAVDLDSKGALWVYKRSPEGTPQLMKYDTASGRQILAVPDSVTGHAQKAHGMKVDADDNVWILDCTRATAKKFSPEGRLLMTIGVDAHRGDWDEAKGQRLLWEPVMIDFGPNGDIYIAEGHGHESPNDTGSSDPTNNLGNSRIIHLDRTGKFIAQYFGNNNGPGKFYSAHGFAVDPTNGDLWIGDREDYRIVVLTRDGKFRKTISTTGLANAINFDHQGNPWYSSGQDGQYLKLNRDGKVLGAVGRGMGIGEGQFIEAGYWAFDRQGNLWAGDTSVGRITKIVAPQRRAVR